MNNFFKRQTISLFCLFLALPNGASASGGAGAEIISYYHILLKNLGVTDPKVLDEWVYVLAGIVTLSVLCVLGLLYRNETLKSVMAYEGNKNNIDQILPKGRFSLSSMIELVLDTVYDLAENMIGKKLGPHFFPLLATIFLFIAVSNSSGIVPGFLPATANISTNLAIGLCVFVVYNIAGVRALGFSGYMAHFMGPVWWLAPLFFMIEIVSHLVRPISLSLRLYGNLFGDHLVMSVLTGLTFLVVPLVSFVFGTLVAVLQSFVFTLLSCIYIAMAVSHEEH